MIYFFADDHYQVHPGHGGASTLQQEREYNPYMQ